MHTDKITALIRIASSGCHEWTGSMTGSRLEYGQLWADGKQWSAHRYAWTVKNGAIPSGMSVLHRCDNPKCVNPEHLFLGTQADNMRDMKSKGRARAPAGERHRDARLTEDAVRRIRFGSEPVAALAREYGVAGVTIYNARNGVTWRHITGKAA